MNLTGLFKVYVAKKQVRIVYEIIENILVVKVIAIGKRESMEVYKQADERR
jgi:mRNA interferase RelE/StbE